MVSDSDKLKNGSLIVILILLSVILPVSSSFEKWKEHPKKILCEYSDGKCELLAYDYAHRICWDLILSNHRTYNSCRLPIILKEKFEIFNLNDIEEVVVKPADNFYEVEIVDKDNETVGIAKCKEEERAINISKQLNKDIKEWQAYQPDYFIGKDNFTFEYNFTEYD